MQNLSPLAKILHDSIVRSLDYRAAIAFSGGLDSTTIAKVASTQVETLLITVCMPHSHDVLAAKEAADALALPLQMKILDENKVVKDYKKCWEIMPGTLTEMELMVASYAVCEEASRLGSTNILFGSGAEELFIGYNKYFEAHAKGEDLKKVLFEELQTLPSRDLARTRAVAEHFNLDARFPLLDKELVGAISSLPISERIGTLSEKKPLLRILAGELGVPDCARLRPKKAMQYSSDIHRLLLRLSREGVVKPHEPRKPFEYD